MKHLSGRSTSMVLLPLLAGPRACRKQHTVGTKTGVPIASGGLAERTLHHRAVEAVIRSTIPIDSDPLYQAMVGAAKSGLNQNASPSHLQLLKKPKADPGPQRDLPYGPH